LFPTLWGNTISRPSIEEESELMTISKEYEHLTNSDVARLMAGHRLVQVGQRERRFENMTIPHGVKLNELVQERLKRRKTVVTEDSEPVPTMTGEAALAQVNGVNSLEDLLARYQELLAEKAPQADKNTDVKRALTDMKSRILTGVDADREDSGTRTILTDDEKVAQYNAINSLDALQAELSAEQSGPVRDSIDQMVGRLLETATRGSGVNKDAVGNDVAAPVAKPEKPAPADGKSKTAKAAPAADKAS
jgi:hypothetical protein